MNIYANISYIRHINTYLHRQALRAEYQPLVLRSLPNSISKFQRVSTTCQCRLGLLLVSAFRFPAGILYQVYQRVRFYLENVGPYRCNRNSAISNRKSYSLPYTKRTYTARSATWRLFLIQICPICRSLRHAFNYVTHQSK